MVNKYKPGEYYKGVLKGDRVTISKLITLVESTLPEHNDMANKQLKKLSEINDYVGRAHIIGLTGDKGVGKSTLVDKLETIYSEAGNNVGIVAVDPTSPIHGGSILGDITCIEKVGKHTFIRSMPSRGDTGGLSPGVYGAVMILEAAGYDPIFVETVGTGQTQVDIRYIADTCVLLLAPETSGEIQLMKKGIMEIVDMYVINKCDLDGANILESDLKGSIPLHRINDTKNISIYRTIVNGANSIGVAELMEAFVSTHDELIKSGLVEESRMKRLYEWAITKANSLQVRNASEYFTPDIIKQIYTHEITVYEAVQAAIINQQTKKKQIKRKKKQKKKN